MAYLPEDRKAKPLGEEAQRTEVSEKEEWQTEAVETGQQEADVPEEKQRKAETVETRQWEAEASEEERREREISKEKQQKAEGLKKEQSEPEALGEEGEEISGYGSYLPDPGEKRERRGGDFGVGVVTGVLATLFCIFVFLVGQTAARNGLFGGGTDQEEEQGAEVLTDNATLYKLSEVESLISENYLNVVDSDLLVAYLFKGIAAGLEDVYANYYTAEELSSVLDSSRGEYVGIGAVLAENPETGEISFHTIYEGGPAEKAGLLEGDVLRKVEDTEIAAMSLTEVVTMIKGEAETFRVTVTRPGTEEELDLELECAEVEVPNVTYEMLEDGIGYIRIQEFTEAAVERFREAALELTDQGMEKLIVDLRDNPGGLLDAVCDILDEILPEKLLVYTEDKNGNREEYWSDKKRTVDCEIAVLVNGNSASASEIFAGAVQDYELGPVIGTTTYGKGVVQKTYPLSDGSAFKMTVETYYTPLGQEIDGNGITPDVVVDAETGSEDETGIGADAGSQDEAAADSEEESGDTKDTGSSDAAETGTAYGSDDEPEETGATDGSDDGSEERDAMDGSGAESEEGDALDGFAENLETDIVLEKALEVLHSGEWTTGEKVAQTE